MHAKVLSSYFRTISSLSVKKGISLVLDGKKPLVLYLKEKNQTAWCEYDYVHKDTTLCLLIPV